MYVCLCRGITDKQVRAAIAAGATDLESLQGKLEVAMNCGTCADTVQEILGDSGVASPMGARWYDAATA